MAKVRKVKPTARKTAPKKGAAKRRVSKVKAKARSGACVVIKRPANQYALFIREKSRAGGAKGNFQSWAEEWRNLGADMKGKYLRKASAASKKHKVEKIKAISKKSKRAPTAYNLFVKDFFQRNHKKGEMLTRIAAKAAVEWNKLSTARKAAFSKKAASIKCDLDVKGESEEKTVGHQPSGAPLRKSRLVKRPAKKQVAKKRSGKRSSTKSKSRAKPKSSRRSAKSTSRSRSRRVSSKGRSRSRKVAYKSKSRSRSGSKSKSRKTGSNSKSRKSSTKCKNCRNKRAK